MTARTQRTWRRLCPGRGLALGLGLRLGLGLGLGLGLIPGLATAVNAQTPRDSFLTIVRNNTARYRDQSLAIADGYRLLGPDFPSMGEHWINVRVLLAGTVSPSHPAVLEYINIDGKPVLAGAAFAVLVDSANPFPRKFPVDSAAWHFHSGSVDQEAFILDHAHMAENDTNGPRIAVLHVWAWLDNPAGTFATDNWALPWIRLGWPAPATTPDDNTARAVALAAGGAEYFTAVLAARDHPDSATRVATRARFDSAAQAVRELLRDGPSSMAMAAAAAKWRELWTTITTHDGNHH